MDRVSTGNKKLDALLDGGYPCGRLTIIEVDSKPLLVELSACTSALVGVIRNWKKRESHVQEIRRQVQSLKTEALVYFIALSKEELPKQLKFDASLRLQIRDDMVKVVKSVVGFEQGRTIDLKSSRWERLVNE